jgi:hypothetical protein
MGILYEVLEGIKNNYNRLDFASDAEAAEYCRENHISCNSIEYESDGSPYVENPIFYHDDINNSDSSKGCDRVKHIEKRNHYSYKCLESLTDGQIQVLLIHHAIVQRSDGTYKADWSKVTR